MDIFGLFLLGALDSSFLFFPFGNDILLIALVAADRSIKSVIYVLSSALGSVAGVFLIDLLTRKAGEEGLRRFVGRKRLERVKARIEHQGMWSIFVATLVPPPFPFTAVVMTASAFQFPRNQLLLVVFFGRLVRFTTVAVLAFYFGRQVFAHLNSGLVEAFIYLFIAIAVVGSGLSIAKWLGRPGKPQFQSGPGPR